MDWICVARRDVDDFLKTEMRRKILDLIATSARDAKEYRTLTGQVGEWG
jgi:transposase